MAIDIETALEWRGRTVIDRDGEKVGTLADIYLDEDERPHWGSVATGLFGTRETLVPLTAAEPEGDELRLPFAADHVKDAPNVDPDVQLDPEDEQRLYRHYELDEDPGDDAGEIAGDDAMTRSEEEVSLRKRTRPRERIRIKKVVVTEHVKKKVPVRREKVRLERDPED